MSDFLSDEEQLARVKSWWSENGTTILVSAGLALALVFGWRWYQADRANKIEEGSSIYAQFLDAEDEAKPALAEALRDVAGGTAYPVLAQLALAQSAFVEEGASAARPILEQALDGANDADLQDLILLRLAKVEQQDGDSEAALAALGKVRGSGYRSLVAELKGDIHIARNEQALAHEAYTSALASVSEGERRPVLALKANTTAAALTGDNAGADANAEQTVDSSAAADSEPEAAATDESTTEVTEAATTDG